MSEFDPTALPPLDDDLASLIGAERRRPGPPSGSAERVRAAVLVTTAAAVAAGSGATLAASTSVAASSSLGASTTASTFGTAGAATSTGGVLAGLSGAAKSGAVVVAALAATAGGSIFVASYDVAPVATTSESVVEDGGRPTPPAGLVVDTPVPALPVAAPVSPATTPVQRPRPTPVRPSTTTMTTPASAVAGTVDEARAQALGVERAIIAEARAALVRGDGDRALIILESHRSAWPTGLLVEEREALTVMALHSAGQHGPARAAAARFRLRWPASLFLDAIARQVP